MSLSRRPMLAVALAAALTVGAGCGERSGGGPASPEGATTSPESGEGREGAVRQIDGFDPRGVHERVSPGVVTVLSVLRLGGPGGGEGGQGSGFVVSDRGEVVTNAHVVTRGDGDSIKPARQIYVEFADRNRVRAKVVGIDPNADIALLRVSRRGLKLSPLPLAKPGEVAVGEPVAAIGSPFGEEQSLSVGVVSATERSIESLTSFQINGAIQTDAAINKGNSGGPLLNAAGRVIGINQQIKSSSGGGEGVGFAVPISAVRHSIERLRKDGRVDYAYLGVATQALYPQLARRLELDSPAGALVADVVEGGPAAKAGIRGGKREIRFQASRVKTGGDVILKAAGRPIAQESDLARAIERRRPGERVEIELVRDGKRQTVQVRLGKRPREVKE